MRTEDTVLNRVSDSKWTWIVLGVLFAAPTVAAYLILYEAYGILGPAAATLGLAAIVVTMAMLLKRSA
ncbi:MAG: hypothetical protein AAB955_00735 [Patescibacteria group bacterium]